MVRGMVTELVHSNCYQMRRGHPGGVPLSVVCPVALQACTFLAGLHAAGECHGNINIRAMGLQVIGATLLLLLPYVLLAGMHGTCKCSGIRVGAAMKRLRQGTLVAACRAQQECMDPQTKCHTPLPQVNSRLTRGLTVHC